jgi:hypothetical protein
MATITIAEFETKLREVKGARMVTFVAKTVPKMVKTDNPFWGHVHKLSEVNGCINWIYQNSVNRQRLREDKEPDFIPAPRAWGQREWRTPFVTHNGKKYLEVKVEKSIQHTYTLHGQLVSKEVEELIKLYLTPHSKAHRQQLDKDVILRDYTLDNIRHFHGLDDYYVIEPSPLSV